ncbi:MAG: SpoIIE family protein phosphatase, partial [Sporomusaceae bacterium]|nr:SpoIIE family protein phosphatase [Sporomusaceae bacterium]
AVHQLAKEGEELCGDRVEIVRTPDSTIIVLSDGLGSGVKANILATMTTKIAASLLKRGIALDEVVDTITETLPVCKVRKIAYSTLHIIEIHASGETTVIEFDSPPTFLARGRHVLPFPTKERSVGNKTIKIGQMLLTETDALLVVSDGVIHAGIGGLLSLGWGWQGVCDYVKERLQEDTVGEAEQLTAERISQFVIDACDGYYLGKPGDDTTVVTAKLRYPRELVLFTGPPAREQDDEKTVQRFLRLPGKKVISGGTTANIFSRITCRPLSVDLNYYDSEVPPICYISDIDLVTEGVLTLNRVVEKLATGRRQRGKDGATLLANLLWEADTITILAGKAVNPAHQNPNFPGHIHIKSQVVEKLIEQLKAMGKHVVVEWL